MKQRHSVGEYTVTRKEILGKIGPPVAFYSGLVPHLGSVNAVLLFCQLLYWFPRATDPRGVYKTMHHLRAETGLSRSEQETARRELRKRGVLVETNARLQHRIYYRLDLDALDELLSASLISDDAEETGSSSDKEMQPHAEKLHSGAQDLESGTAGESHQRIEDAGTHEAAKLASAIEAQTTAQTTAALPGYVAVDNSAAAAAPIKKSTDQASVLGNHLIELEARRLKNLMIDSTSDLAIVSTWGSKGVTLQQLSAAHKLAVAARERDEDTRVTYVAFVNRFIPTVQTAGSAQDSASISVSWFGTCEGVDARGAELGMRKRKPDEPWQSYRVLVAAAARDGAAIEAILKDARRFNSEKLYQFARKTFSEADIIVGD